MGELPDILFEERMQLEKIGELTFELKKTKVDNVKLYGKICYILDYNLQKVVSSKTERDQKDKVTRSRLTVDDFFKETSTIMWFLFHLIHFTMWLLLLMWSTERNLIREFVDYVAHLKIPPQNRIESALGVALVFFFFPFSID